MSDESKIQAQIKTLTAQRAALQRRITRLKNRLAAKRCPFKKGERVQRVYPLLSAQEQGPIYEVKGIVNDGAGGWRIRAFLDGKFVCHFDASHELIKVGEAPASRSSKKRARSLVAQPQPISKAATTTQARATAAGTLNQ